MQKERIPRATGKEVGKQTLLKATATKKNGKEMASPPASMLQGTCLWRKNAAKAPVQRAVFLTCATAPFKGCSVGSDCSNFLENIMRLPCVQLHAGVKLHLTESFCRSARQVRCDDVALFEHDSTSSPRPVPSLWPREAKVNLNGSVLMLTEQRECLCVCAYSH